MVLVDVDDEETSFVDSGSSITIEDYLKSESGLPPLADIIGGDWTRLGSSAVSLIRWDHRRKFSIARALWGSDYSPCQG